MADGSIGYTITETPPDMAKNVPATMPSLAVLSRTASAPPQLPLYLFGPFWASWISLSAEGANASPDYVAIPLLTAASALIGNARWAKAWPGWAEPPVLWAASVGNPSSGKSPGAAPVMRDTLGRVEMHMARDYPAELEQWETVAAVSRAVMKQWEKDVARAIKAGEEMPEKPPTATPPPKPVRPRASVSDSTVEALASILEGQPRGVLHVRDELAGWLLNLGRYANGGSDRPFWLEAYVGGRHRVDRQKHPEPVILEHLSVATFGTIQPERLGEVFDSADDGLAGRFLWTWPDAQPFRRPGRSADIGAAENALVRLTGLLMPRDEFGRSVPSMTPLTAAAADVLEAFGAEMQQVENKAHGLMKSAVGKARGQALRLALVLEYLWWSAEDGMEPVEVDRPAVEAATHLMRRYFLPMAARVLGDAAIPVEEKDARALAQWIAVKRPEVVNVRAVREDAHIPGLRETDRIKGACRYLVEAGWLAPAAPTGSGGRPRGDFEVSPLLGPALDGVLEFDLKPPAQNTQNTQNSEEGEQEDGFGGYGAFGEGGLRENSDMPHVGTWEATI